MDHFWGGTFLYVFLHGGRVFEGRVKLFKFEDFLDKVHTSDIVFSFVRRLGG